MKKLLLFEDVPNLQVLYEMELGELGCNVILASTGQEGLALCEHESPDLVIMDLGLPDINGLQVISTLLKARPDLPVIINSAYSHCKQDIMSWAATKYVVKSADLTELKNAINNVLSKQSNLNYQSDGIPQTLV